jgi:hypothetical protein
MQVSEGSMMLGCWWERRGLNWDWIRGCYWCFLMHVMWFTGVKKELEEGDNNIVEEGAGGGDKLCIGADEGS